VERISLLIMQTLAERSVDRGTVIQTLVDLADILQHEETLTSSFGSLAHSSIGELNERA
jgi:hypothetical protein